MNEVLATYSYYLVTATTGNYYSIACTNKTVCTKAIIPLFYNDLPVKRIGTDAFSGSTTLETVEIPYGVEIIFDRAFRNCTALARIILPESINTIGVQAFDGCSDLFNIFLLNKTPASARVSSFTNISPYAEFYCFQSSVQAYQNAENWNSYSIPFIGDDTRLYFIMNSISAKNYFASKEEVDGKQDKTTYETYVIQTTDWTALSGSDPYTYSATVTATATISAETVVELINDNPVLFATYGFAIASVSGQNITIYSIAEPDANVSLTIGIGG